MVRETKEINTEKQEKKDIKESEEDWSVLLQKWIQKANNSEISEDIKNELRDIIWKYRYYRNLYWKLSKLLKKATLTKTEKKIIENLIRKLEKMTLIQM